MGQKTREVLKAKIASLILSTDPSRFEERDALLSELRDYQREHIAPYARLNDKRGDVALPTDVFRFARVAQSLNSEALRTFRTSGTTSGQRGEHHFFDLELYDLAAKTMAEEMLFADGPMRLVILAPREEEAPDSSLSYMLARFAEWFAPMSAGKLDATYVWPLDTTAFKRAMDSSEKTAVLGTSFAYVLLFDALDELDSEVKPLADGSFVMQTGGFKGKSRTLDEGAMRKLLSSRFQLDDHRIVGEYGMTELSSQMYETTLVDPSGPRRYRAPHWVRVRPVHVDTLIPVDAPVLSEHEGNTSRRILRIDDTANLDSVSAIQTSDFGELVPDDDPRDAFRLFGRNPGAVPRGCGLAAEEALRPITAN